MRHTLVYSIINNLKRQERIRMDSDKKNNVNELIELKMLLTREIAKLEKRIVHFNDQERVKRNSLWLQQIADSIIAAADEIVLSSVSHEIRNIHTGILETISLNPKLTAEKNAVLYSKKAKKAAIDESLHEKEHNIVYDRLQKLHFSLEQVLSLGHEQNSETVTAVIETSKKILCEGAQDTSPQVAISTKVLPFRHFCFSGWDIYAGKSDEQNDELSIHFTGPEDLWFHVAGFAGSHVIIKRPKGTREPDTTAIKAAASIAAWFSKARNAPFVQVHYTEGRFVYKRKNAPHGEVVLEKYRSIKIKPESPETLFTEIKSDTKPIL
jgi:predicted ribosome quality control (RQC) complex YloA/Tae2 family protein